MRATFFGYLHTRRQDTSTAGGSAPKSPPRTPIFKKGFENPRNLREGSLSGQLQSGCEGREFTRALSKTERLAKQVGVSRQRRTRATSSSREHIPAQVVRRAAQAWNACISVISGFFQIKPKIIAKTSPAGFADFVLPSNRFTFNIDTGQSTNWLLLKNVRKYCTPDYSTICCISWNTRVGKDVKHTRKGWWISSSFSHNLYSSLWDNILYLTQQYNNQS